MDLSKNQVTSEKELEKHLKKRVGSMFGGASNEIMDLFGAGRMSIRKKQKANLFSQSLVRQIKPQIKSKAISNIGQIDTIVDQAISSKKNSFLKQQELEGSPTFTIRQHTKPVVREVEVKKSGARKAGAALGGGILLGPVGAIAGYALADSTKTETKLKNFNSDFTFNSSPVEIKNHKISVFDSKGKYSWSILFDNIHFINLFEDLQGFEVIKTDGTEYIFINENHSDIEFTNNLFYELENKFKEYIISNPKPLEDSKLDTVDQIKKLGELKESGLITVEEFESKKTELLKKV